MPRQTRKKSGTGIYHVMLRGINRKDIFEEEEDYLQFLKKLMGSRLFAQTSLTDTFFADILLFCAFSVFFLTKVCTL